MTSKERVAAVFAGELPDRVPRWCGASEEFWLKAKAELDMDDEQLRHRMGDDFRRITAGYDLPEVEMLPGATYCSPFGIQRKGIGYGMPMSHPLKDAVSESEVDSWRWPEPGRVDVSRLRAAARRGRGSIPSSAANGHRSGMTQLILSVTKSFTSRCMIILRL